MKTIIGIIGLGLIGGSIGFSLRKFNYNVIGFDFNKKNSDCALKIGIINKIVSFQDLIKISSIIILSIPVDEIIKILNNILNKVNKKQVVFDTGSTKYSICKSIISNKNRGRFVASHPIAGIENSGPQSARYNLFYRKNCIICDKKLSDPDALLTTNKIFNILKMNVSYMESKEHDIYISYVSHLPHVISFVLSRIIFKKFLYNKKKFIKIIGNGLISTTRLSKSSSDTWTPIFLDNRDNLIDTIHLYINFLKSFNNLLLEKNIYKIHKYLKKYNINKIINDINYE
ncbi:prephenate dehydrogenase/arogenate dehydrogenase family protein [Blattabacterium cuenoti]|uniref:prephenate dehydrogenase/arogenate dehydrogenase family protein n=1 Tax=Blattabacterium cuenoti TaxID=1653831 RepID=UPI00163C6631|nr:prephenate dehydrogenase/arogenate dehydrogenase family protein [Blattabacterium cuenoti]